MRLSDVTRIRNQNPTSSEHYFLGEEALDESKVFAYLIPKTCPFRLI
jgi:hypothetical protein